MDKEHIENIDIIIIYLRGSQIDYTQEDVSKHLLSLGRTITRDNVRSYLEILKEDKFIMDVGNGGYRVILKGRFEPYSTFYNKREDSIKYDLLQKKFYYTARYWPFIISILSLCVATCTYLKKT